MKGAPMKTEAKTKYHKRANEKVDELEFQLMFQAHLIKEKTLVPHNDLVDLSREIGMKILELEYYEELLSMRLLPQHLLDMALKNSMHVVDEDVNQQLGIILEKCGSLGSLVAKAHACYANFRESMGIMTDSATNSKRFLLEHCYMEDLEKIQDEWDLRGGHKLWKDLVHFQSEYVAKHIGGRSFLFAYTGKVFKALEVEAKNCPNMPQYRRRIRDLDNGMLFVSNRGLNKSLIVKCGGIGFFKFTSIEYEGSVITGATNIVNTLLENRIGDVPFLLQEVTSQ